MDEQPPKSRADPIRATMWKPGESGNPAGRPPGDPVLKAIALLTKEEMVEMGSMIVKGEYGELQKISQAPENHTPLKVMITRVVLKIISKGDMYMLDVLLNRLIGKVKDQIEHSGSMPYVTIEIPSNGREVRDPRLERTDIDKTATGSTDGLPQIAG